ncbi:hypothetical protein PRIPAC_80993, partial [Pristionchus pacificus]|uniref:G protein-coupled receptor n=1 Tax=Pristionchus pacificus TaxID=54126 RepID=A0A2A6CLK0_PRIPA
MSTRARAFVLFLLTSVLLSNIYGCYLWNVEQPYKEQLLSNVTWINQTSTALVLGQQIGDIGLFASIFYLYVPTDSGRARLRESALAEYGIDTTVRVMVMGDYYLVYYIMFKSSPKLHNLALIAIAAYLPSAIFLGSGGLVPIASQSFIRELLHHRRPTYEFPELIFGIYAIIILYARGTYRALAENKSHMSESTKASHREMIKGLVIQSCLPAFDCISICLFMLGKFEIVNTPEVEICTHMVGELTVSISPFITLYFVAPYRKYFALIKLNLEVCPKGVLLLHEPSRNSSFIVSEMK